MFWKKKEKFDMAKAYLDKCGLGEEACTALEGVSFGEAGMLDLCVDEDGTAYVVAHLYGEDGGFAFQFCCFPETDQQMEKIREICIEAGLHYAVDDHAEEMDLPEEDRASRECYIDMPEKHWKALTCLLMRELFGVADFICLQES